MRSSGPKIHMLTSYLSLLLCVKPHVNNILRCSLHVLTLVGFRLSWDWHVLRSPRTSCLGPRVVLFCGFLGHMILILSFQVLAHAMLIVFVLSMVVSVIVR